MFRKINLFTILVAILTFILGWQWGHRDVEVKWQKYAPSVSVINREPPKSVDVDFKLFWDTWDLLSHEYLDKKQIDPQKLYYGAISGMVSAVGDPYTVFLPPEAQKASKEDLNGSFEGVGIELGFNEDKQLTVIAPLDGTPADKAGIKPQDLILKIGSKDSTKLSLPEAVKLIRGKKGTEVKLSIFREGEDEPREIKLVRDTIVVKSVTLKFKETNNKKIALLKLSRFGERTKEEWNSSVSDILSSGAVGLILDMRNNPGGFLDGAVFIASEFIEKGDAVLQEDQKGNRTAYKVTGNGRILKLPLVVLINKGSASASEIVAGALQDQKRGKLVGEKSFGKGTIQEAEDLPGGTGIHITTAKWLTPLGRWVNDTQGLEPDVKVELDKKNTDKEKDIQLDKALEILN